MYWRVRKWCHWSNFFLRVQKWAGDFSWKKIDVGNSISQLELTEFWQPNCSTNIKVMPKNNQFLESNQTLTYIFSAKSCNGNWWKMGSVFLHWNSLFYHIFDNYMCLIFKAILLVVIERYLILLQCSLIITFLFVITMKTRKLSILYLPCIWGKYCSFHLFLLFIPLSITYRYG